jgi:hypothetical protein
MYGWSAKRFDSPKKVAELKGQAGVVRDTLDRMTNEATDAGTPTTFLATDISAGVVSDGKLVTRQDPARVTLYYLLILKKRGFVAATDAPVEVEAETETDNVEHVDAEEFAETE